MKVEINSTETRRTPNVLFIVLFSYSNIVKDFEKLNLCWCRLASSIVFRASAYRCPPIYVASSFLSGWPLHHHFVYSSRSYACTRLLSVSICIRLKQRQENRFFAFTRGTVVTRTCPVLKTRFSTANTRSMGALLLEILELRSLSNINMGPALSGAELQEA